MCIHVHTCGWVGGWAGVYSDILWSAEVYVLNYRDLGAYPLGKI